MIRQSLTAYGRPLVKTTAPLPKPAGSEVLIKWAPMRVSVVFQLLGLLLTMRLLTVFFFRDWKQLDDPLSGRGMLGFFAVFVDLALGEALY